ncbi:hypothetical protein D3C81_934340 [compost metagenome]
MAVVLRRAQRDVEGAVFGGLDGADNGVVWATHGDGTAGFGTTDQQRARLVQRQVGRLRWWHQVRCGHFEWRGGIAGDVLSDDGQYLAVDLWGCQVKHEGAVRVDHALADHVATVVHHGDARPCFAATGELGAAVVEQRDDRGRRRGIDRSDGAYGRYVFAFVCQGHL